MGADISDELRGQYQDDFREAARLRDEASQRGDHEEAQKQQEEVDRLYDLLFSED